MMEEGWMDSGNWHHLEGHSVCTVLYYTSVPSLVSWRVQSEKLQCAEVLPVTKSPLPAECPCNMAQSCKSHMKLFKLL